MEEEKFVFRRKQAITVESKFPDGVPEFTVKEEFYMSRALAIKMLERFGWRDWMRSYIAEDGTPYQYIRRRVMREEVII